MVHPKMTSMIFSNVLLLVLVFIALLTNDATCKNKKLTLEDLMNNCHPPASGGPLCLGIDQSFAATPTLQNRNRDMSDRMKPTGGPTPNVPPFAQFFRIPNHRFKVRLIGKLEKTGDGEWDWGDGWVGLAFSKDPDRIMKVGTIGVICIHEKNHGTDLRVLHIQNRNGSTPDDELEPMRFSNQSLDEHHIYEDTIRVHYTMLLRGYLICQFEMYERLFLDTPESINTIDLLEDDYKIGLAYRDSNPLVESGALMGAHKVRVSTEFGFGLLKQLPISRKDAEFMEIDDDVENDVTENGEGWGAGGGGAGGTHDGAISTINKMVISLVLLIFGLRI